MNTAGIMGAWSAVWLSVTTFSAVYINNLVLNRIPAAHPVTGHIYMLVTCCIIRLRQPFHYKPHKLLVETTACAVKLLRPVLNLTSAKTLLQ